MQTYKSTIQEYGLTKAKTDIKKAKIASSKDAEEYIRQFYCSDIEIYESAFALFLNRANNVTGYVKISQGGITGTVMDKVLVSKYAVESLSNGVIIAHNHPSGNLNPSASDLRLTNEIKNCLAVFDISLLDHIILTADEYCSLRDEGKL